MADGPTSLIVSPSCGSLMSEALSTHSATLSPENFSQLAPCLAGDRLKALKHHKSSVLRRAVPILTSGKGAPWPGVLLGGSTLEAQPSWA